MVDVNDKQHGMRREKKDAITSEKKERNKKEKELRCNVAHNPPYYKTLAAGTLYSLHLHVYWLWSLCNDTKILGIQNNYKHIY